MSAWWKNLESGVDETVFWILLYLRGISKCPVSSLDIMIYVSYLVLQFLELLCFVIWYLGCLLKLCMQMQSSNTKLEC